MTGCRPGQAGRGARRRHGRLLHRDSVRPAAARRRRGAGVVGHRARLPRLRRQCRDSVRRRQRGSPAASTWQTSRCRPSRPASGPRSSWPRCRTCCACASRRGTRCSTRRCPTRPTPWARSLRGAGPSPSHPRRDDPAASISTPSTRPTPDAPWCCGRTRPRTRRAGSATSARRRPGDGRTACRSSPTSATPSSPGTARRAPSSSTGPTASWPCTRSRSAPTWPASAWASTRGTPSSWSSCGPCASTPASWSRDRRRRPALAALDDDDHVEAQRARYRERLAYLAGSWVRTAARCRPPQGGFYLWVPVPAGRWPDAWAMAEALATDGGLLVSPGDLYGRGRRRARPGGAGAAHGAVGAGGGAPR